MRLWGHCFSQNANQKFSRVLPYRTNKNRSQKNCLHSPKDHQKKCYNPCFFGRAEIWKNFGWHLTDLYCHHPLYFFTYPLIPILERWTLNMSCCFFPSFFVNKKKETLKSNLRLRHLLHKKKLVWRSKHI